MGSKEIRHQCSVVLALGALRHGFKDDELLVGVFIEVQEGGLVVHSIAVIRRGPEGNQLLVEPVNVAFLNELMCPYDQGQIVEHVEVIDYLMAEDPASASGVPAPSLDVLWVGPHQVSQRTFVGDFLFAIQQTHLVDSWQIRRQSSMHTQDVPIDNRSQWQEIKGLIKIFPTVGVAVFFVDLIEKAIHHGDVPALMVATQQVNAVGILDLQAEQQGDCLYRVVASVDKIADHDEFVVRQVASLLKEVFDVVELSVDVTGDVDWGVNADDVGLFGEDALDHVAEGANCRFGDGFAVEG